MLLSAVLGNPDQPHFPHPRHHSPTPPPYPCHKKKKSPKKLRCQEGRQQEALAKAEEATSTTIITEEPDKVLSDSLPNEVVSEAEVDNAAEKNVVNSAEESCHTFKC